MRNRIALVAGFLLALGAFAPNALAGTHGTQAGVHPFLDCVTQGSGSYSATFGYRNDDSTAKTIVVGTDNYFTPPPIDRGQTTVFQPGTVHNAFTVAAVPTAAKLTWTVTVNGHTESVNVSSSGKACVPALSGAIHVYVDCVTKHATGYDATFAYANDNTSAQTIPVGTNNFFSPLPIDRGQTTSFQPGLHHAAFTVTAIPLTTSLAWTVAFGGVTRTAIASTGNRSCTPPAPVVKPIAVFVQCVTLNQGNYDATFGYNNANATTQTKPVGGDNFFSPSPTNRGQTTTFQPGKTQAAFTVKGIPNGTTLSWTVKAGGNTSTATAIQTATSCAATNPPPPNTKVTLCHKTDSGRWVPITVNANSVAQHLHHGDLIQTSAGCPAPTKHHKHGHGHHNGNGNGNGEGNGNRKEGSD